MSVLIRHYRIVLFCLMHFIFGYSLSQGWGSVTLIALAVIFFQTAGITKLSWKRYIVIQYIAQTIMMFAACWWFKDIIAIGWSQIAGMPPSFWLLVLMFLISLAVSIFTTGTLLLVKYIYNQYGTLLPRIYIWSAVMTSVEIIRSVSFSLITYTDGAPIEPSWNLFSIAHLSGTLNLSWLGRTYGFWGSSFILYVTAASIALVIYSVISRRYKKMVIPTLTATALLAIGYAGSKLYIQASDSVQYQAIAVADNHSGNDYLKFVLQDLPTSEHPTIVVLPEYSNLLNPYGNSSFLSFNKDVREEIKQKLDTKEVYFVGTEDVRIDGKRYVETYMVDNNLSNVSTKGKTFLIPGGEYSPAWVKKFLSLLDKQTVYAFVQISERHPMNTETRLESSVVSEHVALGACSAILQPYTYRDAVNNGARVLTNNISLEQFSEAQEYSEYSHRFARFASISLRRHLITGVRGGSAKIYNPDGDILAETNETSVLASQSIAADGGKTIYATLGDAWILGILASPLLVFFYSSTHQLLRKRYSHPPTK